MDIDYQPRPEYGLVVPLLPSSTAASPRAVVPSGWCSPHRSRWSCEGVAGPRSTTLRAGETRHFALHRSTLEQTPARVWSQDELAGQADATPSMRGAPGRHCTRAYDGPWADLVHHSGVVLQGLSFQPSGAIVAAATTSLPEGVGRRAQLGLPLLLGARRELHDGGAVGRRLPGRGRRLLRLHDHRGGVAGRVPSTGCRSCSASAASTTCPSASLPHLEGWRDSRPVRVGNGAWNQRQIDVYGELLGAAQRLADQLGDASTRTPSGS